MLLCKSIVSGFISDIHERGRFPDPGMPSLPQGEAIIFPVFFQINS